VLISSPPVLVGVRVFCVVFCRSLFVPFIVCPLIYGFWLPMVSFTNKADRHDIAEILLKVVLNTITLVLHFMCYSVIVDLKLSLPFYLLCQYSCADIKSLKTSYPSLAGTAYPYGAHQFTPSFSGGSSFLCSVLSIIVCLFLLVIVLHVFFSWLLCCMSFSLGYCAACLLHNN
jgi:hypothetical protein